MDPVSVHLLFNEHYLLCSTKPVPEQDLAGGPVQLVQVPQVDHWVPHFLDWTQVRTRAHPHSLVPPVSTAVSWHPGPLQWFLVFFPVLPIMPGLPWGSCGQESLWIYYVDAPALVTVAAVGFDCFLLLKPIVSMRC